MNNMLIGEALTHEATHVDLLDREVLLAHTLKKNREYIVAHEDEKISYAKFLLYRWQLRKRKNNIPLAYIVGYKEFFGHTFLVNKHTLVPRPDTELLVDKTIECIRQKIADDSDAYISVIDIGTGSGCIPISMYKACESRDQHERIIFCASDVSSQALSIARKNAHLLNAKIEFKKGNLLEPYHADTYTNNSVIITANLPYLTHEQFAHEKSIQHEPYTALVADEHGLGLYRQLFEQIAQGGFAPKKLVILCEIDPSQLEMFRSMVQLYFSKADVQMEKDLSGRDRVAMIDFPIRSARES